MAAERDAAERAAAGRRGAGPAGPGRARRRAPGAGAGAAARCRARRRGRRAGAAGRRAGGGAAHPDPPAGLAARAGRRRGTLDLASPLGRLARAPRRHGRDAGRRRSSCRRPRSPSSSAVVGACLDNVARTSAPARRPGCCSRRSTTGWRSRCATRAPASPTGRLEQAAAEGRLGVAESIRGRIADLGGTADAEHRLARHRVGARGAAMTHPRRPPVRRPGARRRSAGSGAGSGGAVTLWTSGEGADPAGLTFTR